MEKQSDYNIFSHDQEDYNDEEQDNMNYDTYDIHMPMSLSSHPSDYSQPPMLSYSYSGISNASSNQQYHINSYHYQQLIQPVQPLVFLQPEQLYTSIVKLVNQVNQTLVLNTDLTLYLLYFYKWSRQKLNQSYFDDANTYQKKNSEIVRFKQLEQDQIIAVGQCQVCCMMKQLLLSPLCQHKYCMQCWYRYAKQQLQNGLIFFPCMRKCEKSPILPFVFIHQYFPDLIKLYLKKICMNYSNVNKSISYCPSTSGQNCSLFCEQVISLTMSISQEVQSWIQCKCGQFYCFQCQKQPHYPLPCEDVVKWGRIVDKEQGSLQWIQKNTKKCPQCKAPVYKYIGCHYIKCVCGAQFCFECTKRWDDQHKDQRGQCLLALKKKSSLQQRTASQHFLQLTQKTMAIGRTLKKNIKTINMIIKFIQLNFKHEERTAQTMRQVRKDIEEAWCIYKWTLVGLFIYKKQSIDQFIQDQFVDSITSLMQFIERIQKMGKMITNKQLLLIKNQMVAKKQSLRKNKNIWIDVWRSC